MERDGYVSLLRSYGDSRDVHLVRKLHSRIPQPSDTFVSNLLVQTYGKCGCVEEARSCFNSISKKNLFSWTLMIAAYARNGHPNEAFQVFHMMSVDGVKPDRVVFVEVLSVCTNTGDLRQGICVHRQFAGTRLESDVILGTALMNMYSRCGDLSSAVSAFDRIPQPNNYSWNSLITAYAENGEFLQALETFKRMDSKPDKFTFLAVVGACCALRDARECLEVHDRVVLHGFESDYMVATQLISMFGKCGRIPEARGVFDRRIEWNDIIGWNSMIAAYAQADSFESSKQGVQLYRQLNQEGGEPDEATFVSVLDVCAELGALSDVSAIDEQILSTGFRSHLLDTALIVAYGQCKRADLSAEVFKRQVTYRVNCCWNGLIEAYVGNEMVTEAMQLFRRMDLEGVKQSEVTFINILPACTSLESVRTIHERVTGTRHEQDLKLRTALITMYGRFGELETARSLLEQTHTKDAVVWNAMINSQTKHGTCTAAFELLELMTSSGLKPTMVTYIELLGACSGSTDLIHGRRLHERLKDSPMEIPVGNALITMYGKCGSLDESRLVFESMKEKSLFTWNSMLGAYSLSLTKKTAGEVLDLAKQMQLQGVTPNGVTLVSILYACSHAGLAEEGGRYFADMVTEYEIERTVEHYGCVIDMLGRLGWLTEAEYIAGNVPCREGDFVSWMSLLGACKIHEDDRLAKQAADKIRQLDSSLYVAYY